MTTHFQKCHVISLIQPYDTNAILIMKHAKLPSRVCSKRIGFPDGSTGPEEKFEVFYLPVYF
jgi:hypothetical protein